MTDLIIGALQKKTVSLFGSSSSSSSSSSSFKLKNNPISNFRSQT